MAQNTNRPLKAYVRFDGTGRIVPSSLILRRKKPKVGKWVEIPAYECCNYVPTTTTTTSSTSSTTTSTSTSTTTTTTTAAPTTTTTTTTAEPTTTTTTTTAEPTTTTTTTAAPTTTTTTTATPTTTTTTTVAGYTIGQAALGGIIAYILQPGDPGYDAGVQHGLVATATDTSTSAEWGCYGTPTPGATGTAIGTGDANTIAIMAGCATAGIAARLCGDLTEGGYSDWYLPSKNELNTLYTNQVAIGGFASAQYWSSTEFDPNNGWFQAFSVGYQGPNDKGGTFHVRAIRSF